MANELDVGRLRLLHAVGVHGSIAGAARSVGLTPSAVSQQLAVLERETAVPLLDRSSRGVALTAAGRALATRAAQVRDVLAAASADLDRLAGSTAGPVRIASVASAAATLVSTATGRVRATDPDIGITVVAAEPERGIGLLLRGDVDVAVVDEYDYVPLALPEGAVVRELGVEPLLLVRSTAAVRDAGSGAGPVRLATLADAEWVMPPEDAACGRAVRAACRTAGFEPRVRWETDDMLLLTTAVADGHGVAVLPRRSVAGGAAAVTVTELRGPAVQRRLRAVSRPAIAARPAVGAVLDALVAAAELPGPAVDAF